MSYKLDTELIRIDLDQLNEGKNEAIRKLRYFEAFGVWMRFYNEAQNKLRRLLRQCKTKHAIHLVSEVINELDDLTATFEVAYGKRGKV